MKRRTLIGLATATLMLAPIAASADALADIKERGTLRAAIDLGSPPFGMTDGQMKPIGSEVESAQLLADYLGVDLEIVEVTSPNRVPFLMTGKADVVIASLSITEERQKVIDFADPHGVIGVIVAAPASVQIADVAALAGQSLATTRGSSNDTVASAMLTDSTLVRYDDDATLVTALVSGQNDIMVSSPMVLKAVNERRTADPLEVKVTLKVNPYAVGLRKGEDALKDAINQWVATDLENSKLREIYKKYNGVDLPAEMPK